MGQHGYTSRKLLIASVGVATVNYLVAGCGDQGVTSGNLMITPGGGSPGSAQTGGVSTGGALVLTGGRTQTGTGGSPESGAGNEPEGGAPTGAGAGGQGGG